MSPTTSKIKALQAEAKAEAASSAARLVNLLMEVSNLASEISDMGDAIPVGISTLCLPLSANSQAQAQNIVRLLPVN